jgi:hypothetical protein
LLGDSGEGAAGARPLELGVPAHDSMKCDQVECEDRYALELDRGRALEVELDTNPGGNWNVVVELILRDGAGNELARERTDGRPAIVLHAELPPGRYVVAVRSATEGNVVQYSLVAR